MPEGRVKAHRRRTKGGQVAQVREHGRRRKPGKTKKRGNIEDETMVMPDVVADDVLHEVVVYLEKHDKEDLVQALDKKALTKFLEGHANRSYKANPRFARSLRGLGGPATLRNFMRNWLLGELKKKQPKIANELPASFGAGEGLR